MSALSLIESHGFINHEIRFGVLIGDILQFVSGVHDSLSLLVLIYYNFWIAENRNQLEPTMMGHSTQYYVRFEWMPMYEYVRCGI